MPPRKKAPSNNGQIINFYEHVPKKYLDDIDNKSDIFRYNKKEESIQGYIKYLNDIINQIKNQKLVNPLNKDKIRPHFRNFLQYGENIKLRILIKNG